MDSSLVNHKEPLSNLNSERHLAGDLSIGVNAISRDSFVNSKLVMAVIMIDETNEDIDTAIDRHSKKPQPRRRRRHGN